MSAQKKLETGIKVVAGGDLFKINPKKTHDPDDALHGEEVIRNTGVQGGKVSSLQIALDSIVAPGAVDRLLSELKPMGLDLEIIGAHGRVLMLRSKLRNTLPPWHAFCEALLGGEVCQDYDIQRPTASKFDVLYVKMLTAVQTEALEAAEQLDSLFNAQIPPIGDPRASYLVTCRSRAISDESVPASKPVPAKHKKKIPEGAAVFVMKVMERDHRGESVEIDKLVAKVVPTVPPKLDAEGRNRSTRYVRAAIEKLVGLEMLHLHDQTKVSLSAVVNDGGF